VIDGAGWKNPEAGKRRQGCVRHSKVGSKLDTVVILARESFGRWDKKQTYERHRTYNKSLPTTLLRDPP